MKIGDIATVRGLVLGGVDDNVRVGFANGVVEIIPSEILSIEPRQIVDGDTVTYDGADWKVAARSEKLAWITRGDHNKLVKIGQLERRLSELERQS